jgi:purine-binding chemotaxis protein CheW
VSRHSSTLRSSREAPLTALQRSTSLPLLLCRVGARVCALPIDHVVETLRPLAVEPVAGAPPFVVGVCILRGSPTPVVDCAALLGGGQSDAPKRFVAVRSGQRIIALAVDAVLGVRALDARSLHELPPLLRDAHGEVVSAIGALDAELLLVLRSTHVVPESVWAVLSSETAATAPHPDEEVS